ncbi:MULTISPECIES: hypothetical protein, partial [unclassified Microcoleus]|uniref:hypothetical protein n=1 Tax=unclassified Microcoleus TaxID=2642155 RepID=UPI002FD121C9
IKILEIIFDSPPVFLLVSYPNSATPNKEVAVPVSWRRIGFASFVSREGKCFREKRPTIRHYDI